MALIAAAPAPSAAPAIPTIQQLAAFPAMDSFSLSPDGKHLVALRAFGEDRAIVVYDTANLSKKPVEFGSGKMKVSAVRFLKNDVLGVTLWQPIDLKLERTTKTFLAKLMLVDINGRDWRDPMPVGMSNDENVELENNLSSPRILDELPADPDHILVEQTAGLNAGDIYRVNVHNARSERIIHSGTNAGNYITDLNGDVRARSRTGEDTVGAFITTDIRDPKTGAWSEHKRSYGRNHDVFAVVGFSKDPNIAYVLTDAGGRDKHLIYEYDVTARKLSDVAFEHKFFDASGVDVWRYKDDHFGEIMDFTYEGPRSDEYDVSPRLIALKSALSQALGVTLQPLRLVDPGAGAIANIKYPVFRYLRIISVSEDFTKALAWVGGPNDPGAYYLLHDGQLDLLSRPYPAIDPAVLGKTSLVYYTARDGMPIPGFLTTPSPSLYGSGPWPTVIMPHGGPWARDELDWDWSMWPQLLASRGYAVLQPQYRGSTGWGNRLWRAGDAQWGLKMQDDKDDGVRWLIDQHVAQPGRVAMFGFSYGGYAAMDAAVRPNGLYKCAIAGAGVSDIRRIWADFYRNPLFRESQAPTVRGTSPVDYADKIGIPIMVYAGDRDTTVPLEQSVWFVNKAKGAGKDVVYHQLADFAHGPAWTRAVDAEQLGYIEDYLKTGCGGHGL